MVLHQLFDTDNHVNRNAVNYIFNTEGHLFPVSALLRQAAAGPRPTDDVSHSRQNNPDMAAADETGDDETTRMIFTLPRLNNLTSNVSWKPLLVIPDDIGVNFFEKSLHWWNADGRG